jgi:hypothetical protein
MANDGSYACIVEVEAFRWAAQLVVQEGGEFCFFVASIGFPAVECKLRRNPHEAQNSDIRYPTKESETSPLPLLH